MSRDDPSRTIEFQDIRSSDRVLPNINVNSIPKKTQDRISDLTRARKTPEEVFDQMRREGFKISLDEIYAVTRR